jgi:hypothetical protein
MSNNISFINQTNAFSFFFSFFFRDISQSLSSYIRRFISSSVFRDIDDERNQRDLKELRKQIDHQLRDELNVALLADDVKEKERVHKEIDIFDNFIKMSYFKTLNDHFDIIVNMIRDEIRQNFFSYIKLTIEFVVEDNESTHSFSFLFIDLVSAFESSSSKRSQLLSRNEKLALIIALVQNKNCSVRRVVTMFEINRVIVKRRLEDKRSMTEFEITRQLLSIDEKTVILRFINDFIALSFSSRLFIIKEKTYLFFRHRDVAASLKAH